MTKPRIWISNAKPMAGEIVRVRALIEHRMESGMRLDNDGNVIPRHIVHTFTAKLNDQLLFTWQPETAISQNPYIEFTFVARESGTLSMQWVDDANQTISGAVELEVNR
ncbi:thiosulfate oxidation carrier complex protein SoxZ [Paenalcaligenes hermetiae]|uniref:Thiosulfate oxidation carrier complex protein SoxZ n=1 Tax=Paenalcaligenes hermetiae TaxID=1157987 RepID=A0ABP9MA37_9BURK